MTARIQTLWKLTTRDNLTRPGCYNQTKWGAGVTNEVDSNFKRESGYLCSECWLHAYEHPVLGLLMNSLHAGIERPKLWRARGAVGLRDRLRKCGTKKLTTVECVTLCGPLSPNFKRKLGLWLTLEMVSEHPTCYNPNKTKFVSWARKALVWCGLTSGVRRNRKVPRVPDDMAFGSELEAAIELVLNYKPHSRNIARIIRDVQANQVDVLGITEAVLAEDWGLT